MEIYQQKKFIRNCRFNNKLHISISTDTFPDELKIADIVPVFKKEDQNDKTIDQLAFAFNFKIFEKAHSSRLKVFQIRSPTLCGFRKGHKTQHALLICSKNGKNV